MSDLLSLSTPSRTKWILLTVLFYNILFNSFIKRTHECRGVGKGFPMVSGIPL